MRKISLLCALLCASLMSFAAIDWNNYEWLGDGAGGGAYSNKYKLAPAEGQNVVNIQHPGFADEDGIYTTFPAGITSCTLPEGKYAVQGAGMVLYLSAFTQKETEVTVVHGNGTCVFTVYYVDGEEAVSGKSDPELTLNATDTTLNAATSETFQIVPTKNGDGAVTYSSNNSGIASVSEAGLVTAVGRGTAKITVNVAETETYKDAVATLTVTVTGPINWDAVGWLANSNDKYKLVIEPEISDNFGGKRIEGENLWIGFPSAVWGDNSSVQHTAVGAGVSFPLSQFPNEFNDFQFICDGVTYLITLYYADGTPASTAIDQVFDSQKARKVMENGQLYIIKNGVRYNAIGAQVK